MFLFHVGNIFTLQEPSSRKLLPDSLNGPYYPQYPKYTLVLELTGKCSVLSLTVHPGAGALWLVSVLSLMVLDESKAEAENH